MKRSHSRHSYPFDKRVPLMEKCYKVFYEGWNGEIHSRYEGYNSLSRQLIKKMHKKKQRQYDKNLCREII